MSLLQVLDRQKEGKLYSNFYNKELVANHVESVAKERFAVRQTTWRNVGIVAQGSTVHKGETASGAMGLLFTSTCTTRFCTCVAVTVVLFLCDLLNKNIYPLANE